MTIGRSIGCFRVLIAAFLCVAAAAPGLVAAPPDSAAAPTETAAANPRVVLVLEKGGEVTMELFPGSAPKAVERIITLVKAGFYDGLPFHRVEPYLVQIGAKEHSYPPVEGEMFRSKLRHEVGMVGMARLPDNYDSATTQFYIMKQEKPGLNGEYTVFGKVVAGMDLVLKIKKNEKIVRAAVLDAK